MCTHNVNQAKSGNRRFKFTKSALYDASFVVSADASGRCFETPARQQFWSGFDDTHLGHAGGYGLKTQSQSHRAEIQLLLPS